MTLEQMKAQLGMESVPEVFESLYEQVKDTWQDRAALILSDAFITDVIERLCGADPCRRQGCP